MLGNVLYSACQTLPPKRTNLTVSFQYNALTCGCVNFGFANEWFGGQAAQVVIFPVCSWGVLLSNNCTLPIPWRLFILPVWVGQLMPSDPLPVFSISVSCFQADEPLVICWIGKVLNFFLNELPFSFGVQGNQLSSIFSALFFTVSPSSDFFVVEGVQRIILNS